jgi:hypothetical protein
MDAECLADEITRSVCHGMDTLRPMSEPSEYELREWRALQQQEAQGATRAVRAVGDTISSGARAVGAALGRVADRYPRVARTQKSVAAAAHTVGKAVPEGVTVTGAAWASAAAHAAASTFSKVGRTGLTPEQVVAKHRDAGHAVDILSDIRKLDLQDADALLGRGLGRYYPAAAAASGMGTGFVITGGEVLTGATGGAAAAPSLGAIAGAMAVDASAVLTLSARAVGQVALAYGYDPDKPEEKIFALSIINLGTALSSGSKIVAMADISQLTQALYRRASWEVLNASIVSQLYVQFGARFGVRVTKQGLGRVVPVVGIAIGGVFNWATLEAVVDSAQIAYRRRFLLEKYPDLERPDVAIHGDDIAEDEVISVLDELVDLGGPNLRANEPDHAADDDEDPRP